MKENKQVVLDRLCDALRSTKAAGTGNALVDIRYVVDPNGDEFAVPVFADGTGAPSESFPHGYYAVNISCDSGIAIIMDVVDKFVRKVW